MITLTACQVFFNNHCALSIDSLNISQNKITAIIGSNGSGKTLLLKLIAGLLSHTGSVIYDSELSFPQKTWVPQSPVLLNRSVYENIALPLQYQQIKQSEAPSIQERTHAALIWADIEHLKDISAKTLSTGQQQIVALARARALSPKLLLLDEPCANLDPKRQQHVETLIEELCHNGCKIIMSTHQLSQARRIANDIIFMSQGKAIEYIDKDTFFTQEKLYKSVEKTIAKEINDFICYH